MERELVIRAQAGDHVAFSTIAATSIGRLTATARLILHDEYRAQDAVQEALVDASGGDIYVGDPATGETTAIVTGPDNDWGPIFSPDGSRIAFVRSHPPVDYRGGWDPVGTSDIVVVGPDGSDPRVITLQRQVALRVLGWTPDSAYVLASLQQGGGGADWVYVESAFDAARADEPRDIREVLRDHPTDVRPPNGDRSLIVSEADHATLEAGDADGAGRTVLFERSDLEAVIDPSRVDALMGPYIWWASWSPDGSNIALVVGAPFEGPCGVGQGGFEACMSSWTLVMNADGRDLRRVVGDPITASPDVFVTEQDPVWSPDSSRIVFDRMLTRRSGETTCCSIVVADVATGAHRVIDVPGYEGAPGADARTWSPDGRSLLVTDYRLSRSTTIDVETGRATDLPWRAGLAPSWQRVAPD
jgi:hypothetical protein